MVHAGTKVLVFTQFADFLLLRCFPMLSPKRIYDTSVLACFHNLFWLQPKKGVIWELITTALFGALNYILWVLLIQCRRNRDGSTSIRPVWSVLLLILNNQVTPVCMCSTPGPTPLLPQRYTTTTLLQMFCACSKCLTFKKRTQFLISHWKSHKDLANTTFRLFLMSCQIFIQSEWVYNFFARFESPKVGTKWQFISGNSI